VSETREIAVVVRFTRYDSANPKQCVDLMRAFASADAAEAEAARLNDATNQNLRLKGSVSYFVKLARYLTDEKRS
jgi:hypothetical protein